MNKFATIHSISQTRKPSFLLHSTLGLRTRGPYSQPFFEKDCWQFAVIHCPTWTSSPEIINTTTVSQLSTANCSDQRTLKACRFCHSLENVNWLAELPFFEDPIVETEEHVLTECHGYHDIRLKLSDNLKSLIMLKAYKTIMSTLHVAEFGKYLTQSLQRRNPTKILQKGSALPQTTN